MHSIVIKDYAEESELAEVDSVAQVLGPLSTPQINRQVWGEDEFRRPVSRMLLNPREYLADVSDETIERARQIALPFIESLYAFIDLPQRLERLKQPAGPNAESFATLGKMFSGRLASDPVFAVAYLAKQLSTNFETSQSFLKNLDTITTGFACRQKGGGVGSS